MLCLQLVSAQPQALGSSYAWLALAAAHISGGDLLFGSGLPLPLASVATPQCM